MSFVVTFHELMGTREQGIPHGELVSVCNGETLSSREYLSSTWNDGYRPADNAPVRGIYYIMNVFTYFLRDKTAHTNNAQQVYLYYHSSTMSFRCGSTQHE